MYDRVDDNPDIHTYLQKNRQKFAYILDCDPENSNFADF